MAAGSVKEREEMRQALRQEIVDRKVSEEAEWLGQSLGAFVKAAWPHVKKHEQYRHNWHLDAINVHLEAVSASEIHRLQIWVPPGSMKPVDIDALVLMGDGTRKRLGDVVVGETVITHRGRPRGVTAVHEQGELRTLRITTESGREVAAAPDHPFLTPEGWKLAANLKVGDVLGMRRSRFDETIQPDPIVSVEDGGMRECRCLTVVEDGSFTANDLIVKNSLSVSVFWHAWEWTTRPWLRYWSASYETRLAGRLSAMSRDLMMELWYQERWGHLFDFNRDAEHYYGNNQGGTRLATSPDSSGTGEHGHRILIDDPINAKDADADSKSTLNEANKWFDSTVPSRGLDGVMTPDGRVIDHARVIIMQRLHVDDLAAHALSIEPWVVLCIPERYYSGHPYAYRGQAGRTSKEDLGSIFGEGDPRAEDEILWPERRSEAASNALSKQLRHRSSGQLQQMPAPKEGQSLLRSWWRFYEPNLFNDVKRRPHCTMVVQSVDCPLKDKQTNDMISIQAWGCKGADRYLIDIRTSHMSYSQAKRAVIEQAKYVRAMYPKARQKILIENGGYGPELIIDLKRILTGVEKIPAGLEGDKEIRADSAADDLQAGNVWLPGIGAGADVTLGPAGTVAKDIHDFIESCAVFPHGKHDDDVDAWSMAMNWLRSQIIIPGRTGSAFKRRRRVPA